MRMVMSIWNGACSLLLIHLMRFNIGRCYGIWIPMDAQQALAKLHLMNKCSKVSSLCSIYISHTYESRCIFLLLSIPPVFILSFINNQKKTWCFGWDEVFHSHLKDLSTWACPFIIVYTFYVEYCALPHIYIQISFHPFNSRLSIIFCNAQNWSYASRDKGRWKRLERYGIP